MKFYKIIVFLTIGLSASLAHDVWIFGQNEDKFNANIGFGHDFAKLEDIPENKRKSFATPVIIDKDGKKIWLKQTGVSYHYESERLEKSGSYALLTEFTPIFLTQDKDGKWHDESAKQDVRDAAYCLHASLPAKTIINIGETRDKFVTEPLGQRLEIVPLENPENFRVDKPFKVKVLFEGKPLKTAKVMGTFDGFLKDKSAFYGTTDLKGEIEILALRSGKWMLKVEHKFAFEDKLKCDEELVIASLAFEVKPK